uniref:C2H2-type domain-containing protein n=1 Tax=Leptobrachium leishanense TaxID=445787 RepID=A0A8C5PSN7_9ANUR
MTGETKHVYSSSNKEPSCKDSERDTAFEHFNKNDAVESATSRVSESSDSAFSGGAGKGPEANGREKEPHSQREAIIRPQQAGKIDFKSLQNRSKFQSDAVWTNGKSGPLSPTGRSRGKDKSKRSGKGDRTQHQLYRLSITNTRSNPTIGIAYPQQKVTPPKKVEVNREAVSGSYRFHVPSLPEREAELQQEDLNFNRCFQESSPSLAATNYTSQNIPASRTHHGIQAQAQPGNTEAPTSNGELHYLDFQPNGNSWNSSDKNFSSSANYSIANQKLCPFPDGNKPDSHCYGSMPFQYPFQSLQEPNGNAFCSNAGTQDFVEVSLPANQVSHGTFPFQSSSRDGPEHPQSSGSYNNPLPDTRTYGLSSQQAPFLHVQQGAQHQPAPQCYPVRNNHPTDHNGAMSSSGAVSSSGAIDQTPSTFHESQPVFMQSEFSLHNNNLPALVSKRLQPPKDFASSRRLLTPGNTLRRNIPQSSPNQVHFPGKVYDGVNTGSVPFDKSISRIPQTWDAGSKTFQPLDQNSVQYSNASGTILPYQCQSNVDQRQAVKTTKMPWQQAHLSSALPNQNRVELSKQIGNQKHTYPLGNSEWPNINLLQKIPPSYHSKKHLTVEGIPAQRAEAGRSNFNSTNGILYDGSKEVNAQICDTRNKSILFGLSQPMQQAASSRNNSNQTLSGSPCESPLPSPATNPVSGSSCSSLSPMSTSPVNSNVEDNHAPPTLTSAPYFQQPCHPNETKSYHQSEPLNPASILYPNQDSLKNFSYLSESSKDDQLYHKQSTEPGKGCLENFENEPPPPYSSHHLLANSLSSANLDQLDVLLTCKQCDQNYNNLLSFLEHRQYCSLNSNLHNEMKDSVRGGEVRKQAVEPVKTSPMTAGLSMPKGPVEVPPYLIGFNKVVDYLLDSDILGDPKDDPMKANIFHNLISSSLPLTSCDTLEMDDAKLDSLITEALNGLEFQVDNPEIDSSFIDVFADDDLSAPKVSGSSQPYKFKDSVEMKRKQTADEKQFCHNQFPHVYEENHDADASVNLGGAAKRQSEPKNAEVGTARPYSMGSEKNNMVEKSPKISDDSTLRKKTETEKCDALDKQKNESICEFKRADDKATKTSHEVRSAKRDAQQFSVTEKPKPRRLCMKDIKKKKAHNGTWSKELIHKIVQQKNKFHKLHVKSNKNVQFSLVTERLFPLAKSHTFGEYDYNSDSEDEAVLNSKKQTHGRLKFNFSRNHQGRDGRTKEKDTVWRMGEATRFQIHNKDVRSTNKETSNRIRRRSSQSSTSSDQSTSISSETGLSPKSIERTDSENEQETILRHKGLNSSSPNIAMERHFTRPHYKEGISETFFHQTEFTKVPKRFGSAKFLLGSSKGYPAKHDVTNHIGDTNKSLQSKEKTKSNENQYRKSEVGHFLHGDNQEIVNACHKASIANDDVLHRNFPPGLLLDVNHVPLPFSPIHEENVDLQTKKMNDSEINLNYTDAGLKFLKEGLCNDHEPFPVPVGCYSVSSPTENTLNGESHESYTTECQQFAKNKDLQNMYCNNLFSKSQSLAPADMGQGFLGQSNSTNIDNNSFETNCSELPPYSTDNNVHKVSSTLSFDSSPMFAELPMSDFETPLFTNLPQAKDSYVGYTCSRDQSGKPAHYDQEYPPFLEEKNWSLIEGPPVISSNINTPFPVMENQSTEKYVEQITASSGHMQMTMSEPLPEYNAPFINNISEDELEIKRLVTELENQLQTNNMHSDTSSHSCNKSQTDANFENTPVPFADLGESQIENGQKNIYKDNFSGLNSSTPLEQSIQQCHALDKVEDNCDNLKNSWSCSVQFDTFTSSIQCHNQSNVLESLDQAVNSRQYPKDLNLVQLTGELDSFSSNQRSPSTLPEACLRDLADQPSCQARPGSCPITDPPVTAETLASGKEENKAVAEKDPQQSDPGNLLLEKEQVEERFGEPPELEPFQSVSEFISDFGLRDNDVPILNRTTSPTINETSLERELCDTGYRAEIAISEMIEYDTSCPKMDEKEGPVDVSNTKDLQKNDEGNSPSLDMPVLEKEQGAITEKLSDCQDATESPLQQLQLFVARTAKNNEEEMFMPCFPVLLTPSSHVSPQTAVEIDSSYSPERKSVSEETLSRDLGIHLSETDIHSAVITQIHSLENEITSSTSTFETLNNAMQNGNTQSLCTENECPGLDVINIEPRSTPQDNNDLQPRSNDTENLFRGQAKMDEEMKALIETDGNKVALTVDINRSSTYSCHAFDDEAFAVLPKNTPTAPGALEICSSHKSNAGYQLPCGLTLEVIDNHVSQEQNIDASIFMSPGNQQDVINNILQEKDLMTGNEICKETVPVSPEKSSTSVFPDEIPDAYPLHFNHQKALHKRNTGYQTQLPDMCSPMASSRLDFDRFTHLPLKTSVTKPIVLCPSPENILCAAQKDTTHVDAQNCPVNVSDPTDQTEKLSVVGSDVLLYLGQESSLTSSLEMSHKSISKSESSVSPGADGNLSRCFCPELLCPHYKQPVADAILQCGSMPIPDGYPIFVETDCQQYTTLSNELFTNNVQNVEDPSLCCQKDESLKWDSQKGVRVTNLFPNEDQPAALVSDLMDIAENGFNLNNHQIPVATDGRIAQAATICTIAENQSKESKRKGTNDMDSVIDGVLRILDCDKSKEILENIGIPARSSPSKEKKPAEPSLICDICSIPFRSKPGLSRHKAAKHNTKNDGTRHKEGSVSENFKAKDVSSAVTDCHVLQSLCSESMSQKLTTELLNQESNPQIHYFMLEEQQRNISKKSKDETSGHMDNSVGVEVAGKKRLNGKIKKRKMKIPSNKTTNSQVPSDDILNILKTNILKAIGQSSSFTSSEENVPWTPPTDNDKVQNGPSIAPQDTFSAKHVEEVENMPLNVFNSDINKESLLAGQPKWPNDFNGLAQTETCKISEMECSERMSAIAEPSVSENTLLSPDNCLEEHLIVRRSTLDQNDQQASSKHVEPDLHSLFDDDKTFSELFPRDDHFIRRKCTRVYGKKAKRQTPPFETDFKTIDLDGMNSSSQAKTDQSEHGRILADENLLGSRVSLSHTEPDQVYGPVTSVKDQIHVDDGMLSFEPHSQGMETMADPLLCLDTKEENDKEASFEQSPVTSHNSFVERSSSLQDSELEEVFDCKLDEDENLPKFPTIDMKMLSAKFDMRELSFFSACGDDSDQSDTEKSDVTSKTEKHKRQSKTKASNKKQLRNRSNGNIKTKEKQYKCKVCFQWFLTLGELDFHKLTHNPSPPPTCYMCVQRKFSSREQLRDHLKEKHAKNKAGLWICGMCLKEISDVWMYNEHLREHATQFARKGQAQKTVMGIPGCFAEDNLVRTFLSTFIYRTPAKSSKTSESEAKSPSVKKQDHKDHNDEEELVTDKEQENNTFNAPSTSVHEKLSISPTLEATHKSETVQKNSAIHPHCKDPSRDCHHCGKQFPKPFKLQRHLVVHSLQKIYLCHKCPKSYQEVQELRTHLSNEHQLSEETEIKHTTLYACELCADVMHVIKKSFICSTCNYTFSKKEQYDRHMEKHLIGGSMTFKFRGVMRPCLVGKETKDKTKEPPASENIPPSKKQKVFHCSESPPYLTSIDTKTGNEQIPSVQPVLSSVNLNNKIKVVKESKQDIAIKMENMVVSLVELYQKDKKKQMSPTATFPMSPVSKEVQNDEKGGSQVAVTDGMNISDTQFMSSSPVPFNDMLLMEHGLTPEPEPPVLYPTNPEYMDRSQLTPLHNQENVLPEVTGIGSPQVCEEDLLCHLLSKEPEEFAVFASNHVISTDKASTGDVPCSQNETVVPQKEDALKLPTLDSTGANPVPSKVKNVTSSGSGSLKDVKGPKKNKATGQVNRSTSGEEVVVKSCMLKLKATSETSSVAKDNSVCTLKEVTGVQHKIYKKEPVVYLSKHNSIDSFKFDDKASTTSPSKLHPKKRKEHKMSGHKNGSASRENMVGDVKKKKTSVIGNGKSESSVGVRKPDWMSTVSAFSEIKEDTLVSRLPSKPQAARIGSGQLKKTVLDTHNQKKANARAINGEYKCKKVFHAKSLQPFTSKSSALSVNSSSSQKRKLGHNIKPAEPSNYRTAESQNNLLSQLFGQKLTSFKIPLRRDITE